MAQSGSTNLRGQRDDGVRDVQPEEKIQVSSLFRFDLFKFSVPNEIYLNLLSTRFCHCHVDFSAKKPLSRKIRNQVDYQDTLETECWE